MAHVQFILIITFTLTESLKLTPNCILQTVNILFPHEEGKTCQSFIAVSSHGTTLCLSFCFLCQELFYELRCFVNTFHPCQDLVLINVIILRTFFNLRHQELRLEL